MDLKSDWVKRSRPKRSAGAKCTFRYFVAVGGKRGLVHKPS